MCDLLAPMLVRWQRDLDRPVRGVEHPCRRCVYCTPVAPDREWTRCRHPETQRLIEWLGDEIITCRTMRSPAAPCGPDGVLFEMTRLAPGL